MGPELRGVNPLIQSNLISLITPLLFQTNKVPSQERQGGREEDSDGTAGHRVYALLHNHFCLEGEENSP